jgi:ribosomal protein S18 acetylase RimI-like enzyme
VLLARLAVDRAHHGQGLGRSLLQDAMLRANEATEELGIRLMLVHAKNEHASAWYKRFGFEESPTDPLHLILLMKDLRALLSSAGHDV